MAASNITYFFESLLRNETILVRVASGSSPGINAQMAIAAVRRAVNAPSQANKSCV